MPAEHSWTMARSNNLVVSCAFWYLCNLLFNLGMKRSFQLLPSPMLLTSAQFSAGALAWLLCRSRGGLLGSTAGMGRGELCVSAALFLGGTLCTNLSLTLLSISFTHVVKTCEPVFTVAVCYCMFGEKPRALTVLALVCIVLGVVIASFGHRQMRFDSVGLGIGMLANLFLQTRNVHNKKLLETAADDSADEATSRRSAVALMLLSCSLALPMQLALHAATSLLAPGDECDASARRCIRWPDSTEDAAWLAVTPVAFVLYQLGSIVVLAGVHPVAHALLNSGKRAVVIGLGALLMAEALPWSYVAGAAIALLGGVGYSLSKPKLASDGRPSACQLWSSLSLLLLFATAVLALQQSSLAPTRAAAAPPPPPPHAPHRGKHVPHYAHVAHGRMLSKSKQTRHGVDRLSHSHSKPGTSHDHTTRQKRTGKQRAHRSLLQHTNTCGT